MYVDDGDATEALRLVRNVRIAVRDSDVDIEVEERVVEHGRNDLRRERIGDVNDREAVRIGRCDERVVPGDRDRGDVLQRSASGKRRGEAAVLDRRDDCRVADLRDVDHGERVANAWIWARLPAQTPLGRDVRVVALHGDPVCAEEPRGVPDGADDRRMRRVGGDVENREAVAGPVVVAFRAALPVAVLAYDKGVTVRDVDRHRVDEVGRPCTRARDDRVGRISQVDSVDDAAGIPGNIRVVPRDRSSPRARKTACARDRAGEPWGGGNCTESEGRHPQRAQSEQCRSAEKQPQESPRSTIGPSSPSCAQTGN